MDRVSPRRPRKAQARPRLLGRPRHVDAARLPRARTRVRGVRVHRGSRAVRRAVGRGRRGDRGEGQGVWRVRVRVRRPAQGLRRELRVRVRARQRGLRGPVSAGDVDGAAVHRQKASRDRARRGRAPRVARLDWKRQRPGAVRALLSRHGSDAQVRHAVARPRVPRQVQGPARSPGVCLAEGDSCVGDEEAFVFRGRERDAHLVRIGRARGPRLPGRHRGVPRQGAQKAHRGSPRHPRRARSLGARLLGRPVRRRESARFPHGRAPRDARPRRVGRVQRAQRSRRAPRRRAHRHRREPLRRHEVARLLRDAGGHGALRGTPRLGSPHDGPRGHASPRLARHQVRRARLQRLLVRPRDGLPAPRHGPRAALRDRHRRSPAPQGPRPVPRTHLALLALQQEPRLDGRGRRLRPRKLHGLHPDPRHAPQGRQAPGRRAVEESVLPVIPTSLCAFLQNAPSDMCLSPPRRRTR
mmetsp:Transcript_22721/g.90141  ORF Transcript_22721/g.90141 Transcript_22721/m.90141 type:complete len:469 (-) Transcript_22721:199-1605(-)